MLSPQSLDEDGRRLVVGWAADCAERVLPIFESAVADDDRPRDAIARTRAFVRGELSAAGEIRRRFVAGRAAQGVADVAVATAARAAAQAAGVAHMGAHALGAAGYAARAVALAAPSDPGAVDRELRWQLERMTPDVRAALSLLPELGSDSAGPLGAGLLARGVVGSSIRALQAALRDGADGD